MSNHYNLDNRLAKYFRELCKKGPNRVVIDWQGGSVNFNEACINGFRPAIIFIRKDGWNLGAPSKFEKVAFKLWTKQWIGFVRTGEPPAKTILEYPFYHKYYYE